MIERRPGSCPGWGLIAAAYTAGSRGSLTGGGVGKRPGRPGRGRRQALLIGGAVGTAAMSTAARAGRDGTGARPRARVAPSALALLESARYGLAAAEGESSAGARYVSAHLAALRAAAAGVAARAGPGTSTP